MSTYLHYQIVRAEQQAIVSRAMKSDRSQARRRTADRQRSVMHRLGKVAAAIGVCFAAGTAVAVADTHSNQHPVKPQAVRVSPQQLARRIGAFEAKGYVPTSCTVGGTLMRNYRTGQSVTVKW